MILPLGAHIGAGCSSKDCPKTHAALLTIGTDFDVGAGLFDQGGLSIAATAPDAWPRTAGPIGATTPDVEPRTAGPIDAATPDVGPNNWTTARPIGATT